MEASQTGQPDPAQEPQPGPDPVVEPVEGGHKIAHEEVRVGEQAPASGAPEGTAAERGLGGVDPSVATAPASEGAQNQVDEQSEVPAEDERNPARDQAPVATDAQEAAVGDPGLHEQQPFGNEGSPTAVDRPVATSAPPPSAQSGVPLPEDRAAGVEPDPDAPVTQPEQAAGQS